MRFFLLILPASDHTCSVTGRTTNWTLRRTLEPSNRHTARNTFDVVNACALKIPSLLVYIARILYHHVRYTPPPRLFALTAEPVFAELAWLTLLILHRYATRVVRLTRSGMKLLTILVLAPYHISNCHSTVLRHGRSLGYRMPYASTRFFHCLKRANPACLLNNGMRCEDSTSIAEKSPSMSNDVPLSLVRAGSRKLQ